jgi:cell division topological specificity factor
MDNFLNRIMGNKPKSASAAKERLKFVLIHDRADITPGQLEKMKNEIVGVISRYVEIDSSLVQINVTQEGREQRLVADIPIVPARSKNRK